MNPLLLGEETEAATAVLLIMTIAAAVETIAVTVVTTVAAAEATVEAATTTVAVAEATVEAEATTIVAAEEDADPTKTNVVMTAISPMEVRPLQPQPTLVGPTWTAAEEAAVAVEIGAPVAILNKAVSMNVATMVT